MRQATQFIESFFSFAVFAIVALAVAGTTYQVFNPDGGLIQWVMHAWGTNPALLMALGGAAVLVKRWLSGVQGAHAADMLFYSAIVLGLYYGFNLLTAV